MITSDKISLQVQNFLKNEYKHNHNILSILDNIILEEDYKKHILNVFFTKAFYLEVFECNCLESLKLFLAKIDPFIKVKASMQTSDVSKNFLKNDAIIDNFIKKFPVPIDQNFKNFIHTNFNIAVVNTINIALKTENKFNRILLYAKSGLGKSHLLYAIYNKHKQHAIYLSISVLIRDYASIKNNLSEFLSEIYKYNILLIDDIQFLEKNIELNNLFFSILDSFLVDPNKRIFIATDTPPDLLINLENRIISRLESFLTITIEEPTPKSIVKIINVKIKNELKEYEIDKEAIDFIAENFYENIRKIDGVFTTIIFNLINKNVSRITLPFLESILQKNVNKNREVHYAFLIEEVAKYLNISESQILANKSDKVATFGNYLIFYLLYNIYDYSFEAINSVFINKSIKTIKMGINKINKVIFDDKNLQKFVDVLKYKYYKKMKT